MNDTDDQLKITSTSEGGTARLAVAGEIDVHTCTQLEQAVRQELDRGGHDVVLDVGEVAFIDSSGLRSLILLQRDAGERGGTLRLASPSRSVRRLLEVTGLTDMFLPDEG